MDNKFREELYKIYKLQRQFLKDNNKGQMSYEEFCSYCVCLESFEQLGRINPSFLDGLIP
jgi:hypothetical protein